MYTCTGSCVAVWKNKNNWGKGRTYLRKQKGNHLKCKPYIVHVHVHVYTHTQGTHVHAVYSIDNTLCMSMYTHTGYIHAVYSIDNTLCMSMYTHTEYTVYFNTIFHTSLYVKWASAR